MSGNALEGAVGGDLNNNATEVDTANGQSQNELLDMVFTLESEKQALLEESRKRIGALRKDFEVSFRKQFCEY